MLEIIKSIDLIDVGLVWAIYVAAFYYFVIGNDLLTQETPQ